LHQNAFGGRAPPGPTGGAYSAPRPASCILEQGKGKEGKGRRRKERGGKEGRGKGKGRRRDGTTPNKKLVMGLG